MNAIEFNIVTLFPNMFSSPFQESILKRGQEKGYINIKIHNLRDFTHDRHKVVDDTPYGGGAGMVLKANVLVEAIEKITGKPPGKVLLTSPQGVRFNQSMARDLVKEAKITIICGRYEGVDERVRDYVDEEISIGDFILTGGEIASMVVVDAVSRLIPGVLGDEESFKEDSFSNYLLEYPHYTRPEIFRGKQVPSVLLSGNHEAIRIWRKKESLKRTLLKRKDLLVNADFSEEEKKILRELNEHK